VLKAPLNSNQQQLVAHYLLMFGVFIGVCMCVCVYMSALNLVGVAAAEQCCPRGIHSHVYDITQKTCNGRHPLCWCWNVCWHSVFILCDDSPVCSV